MGVESYEGAVGEYVFVCPAVGQYKIKLYSTNEQFPVCLFTVLTEIEAKQFRCHEIYVDTFSVNISREAHEVAALFFTVIVPIAAGSPQELAFAESAHRVIGRMSRTMAANAPHMPEFCWGVRDQTAHMSMTSCRYLQGGGYAQIIFFTASPSTGVGSTYMYGGHL